MANNSKIELDIDISKEVLTSYLQKRNRIAPNDSIQKLEKPGEGNMNIVMRVITLSKTLILKQSRPYVAKYPQITAPLERISIENKFYETTSKLQSLSTFLPKILGFDPENNLLVLEDLGKSNDYTGIYTKTVTISAEEIEQLVTFISILHNIILTADSINQFPDNLSLRKLNHEHLFIYPYLIDNGFDLDSIQDGLQDVALTYKKDEKLKQILLELGKSYLSKGTVLIHGDFYPGSWLNVNNSLKIIDPEFCFIGSPEYDLGVMIAHLKLAQTPHHNIDYIIKNYNAPQGFDWILTENYIGMEIMRRIIGLAQLPLNLELLERKTLLDEAYQLILKEKL